MTAVRIVVASALLLVGACDSEPATVASPRPEASPQLSPQPSPEPPSPEQAQECTDATITGKVEVTIRQSDNVFSPDCLVVLGGQGVKIQNRGTALHNFSVEGTQVDLDVQPGETNRTETIGTLIEAGTHAFFCKFHRSLGMEGEITVSEAG